MPKYDSTDTFVYSLGGVTSELVSIGGGEYCSKIESDFLKFKFNGTSWIVKDKQGNTYLFGSSDSTKIVTPQGVFFSDIWKNGRYKWKLSNDFLL